MLLILIVGSEVKGREVSSCINYDYSVLDSNLEYSDLT